MTEHAGCTQVCDFNATGVDRRSNVADFIEGIAYRLVFDFGLHEDCKSLVADGRLTEVDQRVRQITLYGCYVLDKQVPLLCLFGYGC